MSLSQQFTADLRALLQGKTRVAVMGIGSVLCADDAAGMLFVSRLSELLPQGCGWKLIAASTAPENFTGVVRAYAPQQLLLVDAAYFEASPGTVSLLQSEQISGSTFSTHMLPLSFVVSFLAAQGGCPAQFVGVQPQSTAQGEPVCPPVAQAIEDLAQLLADCAQNEATT